MIDDEEHWWRDLAGSVTTACGQTAVLDRNASYPAYRCLTCLAVYGSVGMSESCYDAMREQRAFKILRKQD